MDKIVARMRGGLGNQLFIIAFAYKLYLEENAQAEIVLDVREYEKYKIRNFELLDILEDKNVRLYDKKSDYSLKYEITRKLYHVIQKFISPQQKMNQFLSEKGYYYSKRSARGYCGSKAKNIYVYGYFQDAQMAFESKDILLKHLKLSNKYKINKNEKYIAVSIRCGNDYILQGWPICSEGYFRNALCEIIQKNSEKRKINVFVFSDNVDFAKQMNLAVKTDMTVTYIQGLSAIEQLSVMVKCDDFVISNSSFSWWGAFLGAKADSIIVAPDIWYDTKEPTEKTFIAYKNMLIRKMNV